MGTHFKPSYSFPVQYLLLLTKPGIFVKLHNIKFDGHPTDAPQILAWGKAKGLKWLSKRSIFATVCHKTLKGNSH
jgi:hypothetical protein